MSLLDKIQYLKKEDIDNPNIISFDGLKRVSKYFDENNPLTYKLYLKYHKNLTNEEIAYYEEVIKRLEHNEKLKIEHTYKNYEKLSFENA